jgi:hypothetical protein
MWLKVWLSIVRSRHNEARIDWSRFLQRLIDGRRIPSSSTGNEHNHDKLHPRPLRAINVETNEFFDGSSGRGNYSKRLEMAIAPGNSLRLAVMCSRTLTVESLRAPDSMSDSSTLFFNVFIGKIKPTQS